MVNIEEKIDEPMNETSTIALNKTINDSEIEEQFPNLRQHENQKNKDDPIKKNSITSTGTASRTKQVHLQT